MTSSPPGGSSLAQILARTSLLQGCAETTVAAMASQSRIVQLSMGQPFQRAGQLPPGPAFLLEGRLRRLLSAPGQQPWNLGFVEAGEWVSWSAIWRSEPELTLTASQPSALVLIPAEVARAILRDDATLRKALAVPSFDELAVLMASYWQQLGLQQSDPLPRLRQLLQDSRLLTPGQTLPGSHLLLYSGPLQPGGLQPGERLAPETSRWQASVEGLPARVLAIPEGALAAPIATEVTADSTGASTLTVRNPAARMNSPLGSAIEQEDAEGEGAIVRAQGHNFTVRASHADSRVEQALACILHLTTARRLAFSTDQVRANLQHVEERLGALKLPQVGLQLEALGFETRPLRARAWDLARMEPPAMLDLDGVLVLMLAASRGGVLIGDPRKGLRRYGLRQLESRFPEGLDLLVIRQGRLERESSSFGLGWFLPAFLRYPNLLALTLLTGFFAQMLAAVFPLGVLLLINEVVARNNQSLLIPLTVVLVVAAISSAVLGAARALITADLSDRVDVRLGSTVVEHLLRLPLPYFERRSVGAIYYNINQLYEIRKFLVEQLLGVGLDVVFSLVFLVVLFAVSPTLTLITLTLVPVLAAINVFTTPILQRLIKQSTHYASAAGSYLVEVIGGMRTVKSQNFEVEARWEWLNRYRRYTNSRFRITQLNSLTEQSAKLISNLIEITLFIVGARLIADSQLNIGALIAVRLLSGNMIAPLLRLSSLWQSFQEMRNSLGCIGDIMTAIPEVGEEDLQALPMPPIRGDLRFDGVSFRYGERGPMLLDELDLHIQPGQLVGIVGLSGSGKSTLVQMIDRLYKPRRGHIYLDGYDVEKIQLASLRSRIGYVPQESLLFGASVLDNIRLNNPDADMESVIRAATVADAHEFILQLTNGYATVLGERGAGLSGGQRQRLCLARTVLQDPSFLILDEATSALDADTERRVCSNIAQAFRNNTVLFITHRLTTLIDADRILFMDKGRIIEDGSPQELLNAGGAYATLYAQQTRGVQVS
jgi:subfamily B ATP-binding cassette protein HlyB/CyaB